MGKGLPTQFTIAVFFGSSVLALVLLPVPLSPTTPINSLIVQINLIDFCLNNKPEFEGCDLVDYVYVLYKCSIQTNYRKKEILQIFHEVLDYLTLLYHKEENGFSYYVNKSQTHYYGVEISKGKNTPDIHGTILSIWAVVMILTLFEKNPYEYKSNHRDYFL